jgi:hypothetical protein
MSLRVRVGLRAPSVSLLILLVVGAVASAQEQGRAGVPGRGAGSFAVILDQVTITEADVGILRENIGRITSRALRFELDYGVTDRLAVTASLPLSSNRYVGNNPHVPAWLVDDHGEEMIDDGDFHTYWADFGLGLRWSWRSTDRLALTPFVGYYTPSSDYPIYAYSQPGRGQSRIDAGLNASGRIGPPRRNLHWKAGYAYSFTEETRPADAPARRVNRSRLTLEMTWRATPLISPYFVVTDTWSHDGLDVLEFSGIFVSDQWYYHDQLFPWEQTTWTVGVGYQLSDRLGLSLGYGRSDEVEFGFFHEPAVSIGLNYSFRRND